MRAPFRFVLLGTLVPILAASQCPLLGLTGALEVVVTTDGDAADPDGYRLELSGPRGDQERAVDTDDVVLFEDLLAGVYRVLLADLAPECGVIGDNPVDAEVAPGETTRLVLQVECRAPADGSVIVFRSLRVAPPQAFRIDPDGSALAQVTGAPFAPDEPSVSLDGTKVAFEHGGDIWTIGVDGSNPTRITNVPFAAADPRWSPSGDRVVFWGRPPGQADGDIFVIGADGTGLTQLASPTNDFWPTFSRDGSRIFFVTDRDGNREIYAMNANGTNQVRLTNTAALEQRPHANPSDDRLVYVRPDGGGLARIVVRQPGGGTMQIPGIVGTDPFWSPDGTRVVFRNLGATQGVFTTRIDGTDQVRVTDRPGDGSPSWGG